MHFLCPRKNQNMYLGLLYCGNCLLIEPHHRHDHRHGAPVYCVQSLTHPTAPAGTHVGDSDYVRGVLARPCSGADLRQPGIPRRARGPIYGCSEIATPNRPLLQGRGAAAEALDGSARQLGHGVRNHVPPRASITKKTTVKNNRHDRTDTTEQTRPPVRPGTVPSARTGAVLFVGMGQVQ